MQKPYILSTQKYPTSKINPLINEYPTPNIMIQLLECIPNFSNGRDPEIIRAIANAITDTPGTILLNIDSNYAANRTVYTFVAKPDDACSAAFHAIKTATNLIDMEQHEGAHPRIGAADVCPLVPIHNINIKETAKYAIKLAKRVGSELAIPVYLYEAAATTPERKSLAYIRKGQYENLPEKIKKLPPDFGPLDYNEKIKKTGATIIGARKFLLAYNINIDTKNIDTAKKIARELRNTLDFCKTLAWNIPEFNTLQISTNLTDPYQTPPEIAFETTKNIASNYNVHVTGSELVGMIPSDIILSTGRYYEKSVYSNIRLTDDELIAIAVEKLNLQQNKNFDKTTQILNVKQLLDYPTNKSMKIG